MKRERIRRKKKRDCGVLRKNGEEEKEKPRNPRD